MSFVWKFEIDGDKEIIHDIGLAIDRTTDLGPVWPKVYDAWMAWQKKVFATEGEAIGTRWESLSPNYAAWKAKRYPGKTILRRTDTLYHSLTKRSAKGTVYVPEKQALRIGTDISYAKYHQSREPRRSLPRRPFIMLTPAMMTNFSKLIHKYLWKGGYRDRVFPK